MVGSISMPITPTLSKSFITPSNLDFDVVVIWELFKARFQIFLLVWLNSLSTYAMLAIVVVIWIGETRSYDFRGLVDN